MIVVFRFVPGKWPGTHALSVVSMAAMVAAAFGFIGMRKQYSVTVATAAAVTLWVQTGLRLVFRALVLAEAWSVLGEVSFASVAVELAVAVFVCWTLLRLRAQARAVGLFTATAACWALDALTSVGVTILFRVVSFREAPALIWEVLWSIPGFVTWTLLAIVFLRAAAAKPQPT